MHVTFCCFSYRFITPRKIQGQGVAPFTTAAARLSREHPSMPRIYSSVKHAGRWLDCVGEDTNHYFKQPRGVQRVKGVSFLPTSSFNSIFKDSFQNHLHCNSKLYAEWFAAITELARKRGWGGFLPLNTECQNSEDGLKGWWVNACGSDLGTFLWKLALHTLYMGIYSPRSLLFESAMISCRQWLRNTCQSLIWTTFLPNWLQRL